MKKVCRRLGFPSEVLLEIASTHFSNDPNPIEKMLSTMDIINFDFRVALQLRKDIDSKVKMQVKSGEQVISVTNIADT